MRITRFVIIRMLDFDDITILTFIARESHPSCSRCLDTVTNSAFDIDAGVHFTTTIGKWIAAIRSEERRVGKRVDLGGRRSIKKKIVRKCSRCMVSEVAYRKDG